MSKAAEIRKMTVGELTQTIEDAKQELFNLRFQWETGQLEDYSRIRVLKRQIARLLTIQRERELAVELVQEEAADA